MLSCLGEACALTAVFGCGVLCCVQEHARRKTVTAFDVIYALKRNGRTIYGFGG